MPGLTPEGVRQIEISIPDTPSIRDTIGRLAKEEHNSLSISLITSVKSRYDVMQNGWKRAYPVRTSGYAGFVNKGRLDIKSIFCEKSDPT